MGYRYACADFTFPLLPHDKVLALIALLGFDGVDIGLFENRSHIQPSMVFDRPAENGRRLRESADAAGVAIADVFLQSDVDFFPLAINHADAAVRAETRRQFECLIEYAIAAGSRHITCLPGVHYPEEAYESCFARCAEALRWRVERAKEAGLTFGIEAHLGSIVDTPQKALRLLEAVDGLTLTLDFTHFTKAGLPDGDVEPLIRYASHFHARGAKPGGLQVVQSENTIDYERIVHELQRTGYAGYIGIEYTWTEWEGCNRTDNVSECLLLMNRMKKAEGM